MTSELSDFAARLREWVFSSAFEADDVRGLIHEDRNQSEPPPVGRNEEKFNALALELFALQSANNAAYRRVCEARRNAPETLKHWTEIPAVPTAAFKESDLTCLPPAKRTHVFHSSGTTGQCPSRHFHCAESLAVYETSLWAGFARHVAPDFAFEISDFKFAFLTPPPAQAPHSSLVHMFDTVRRNLELGKSGVRRLAAPELDFLGCVGEGGAWEVDCERTLALLEAACATWSPLVLLGTAFSFVHLLDFLAEQDLIFKLPSGSRVMETGGYKGRARVLTRAELHALITDRLGIPPSHIVCEYGMSELSSQAYDQVTSGKWQVIRSQGRESGHSSFATRHFRFPPWARAQVVSPETGREVAEGETGLIRVFDLANVCSVPAVQTEDLGVRRGGGFEFVGRAAVAVPRGCSLMAV